MAGRGKKTAALLSPSLQLLTSGSGAVIGHDASRLPATSAADVIADGPGSFLVSSLLYETRSEPKPKGRQILPYE